MIYLSMPVPRLRAGLSLMLWCLSLVLWKCATPSAVVCVLVRCVFVLSVCGPSLRAGRGIVPRSNVSVVGSSRHRRDAERNLTPHF